MAVPVIESVWSANSDSTDVTSLTVVGVTSAGSNRLLIGYVGVHSETTTITSVVRGSENFTQGTAVSNAGPIKGVISRFTAPATAAQDIVVTISASRKVLAMFMAVSGVDQTTPVGTQASADSEGATTLSAAPASDTDDLVFGGLVTFADATAHTAGSGETERISTLAGTNADTKVDGKVYTEPHSTGTTTTISPSWTTSTAGVLIALAIKEAAAAVTARLRSMMGVGT